MFRIDSRIIGDDEFREEFRILGTYQARRNAIAYDESQPLTAYFKAIPLRASNPDYFINFISSLTQEQLTNDITKQIFQILKTKKEVLHGNPLACIGEIDEGLESREYPDEKRIDFISGEEMIKARYTCALIHLHLVNQLLKLKIPSETNSGPLDDLIKIIKRAQAYNIQEFNDARTDFVFSQITSEVNSEGNGAINLLSRPTPNYDKWLTQAQVMEASMELCDKIESIMSSLVNGNKKEVEDKINDFSLDKNWINLSPTTRTIKSMVTTSLTGCAVALLGVICGGPIGTGIIVAGIVGAGVLGFFAYRKSRQAPPPRKILNEDEIKAGLSGAVVKEKTKEALKPHLVDDAIALVNEYSGVDIADLVPRPGA